MVPVTVSSMSQMPPNEDVTMRCSHLPPFLGPDSMRSARHIRSSSCNNRRRRRESLQVPSFWHLLQLQQGARAPGRQRQWRAAHPTTKACAKPGKFPLLPLNASASPQRVNNWKPALGAVIRANDLQMQQILPFSPSPAQPGRV